MAPMLRTAIKPSWRALGSVTYPLRSLPDFPIIGTQKGGTTSLSNYLVQHPRIARPMTKEVHFFDACRERGTDGYRSLFPLRGSRAAASCIRGSAAGTGARLPAGRLRLNFVLYD